ncbi:MAG: globin [Pseudomonadales bacterium]
MTETDLIMKSLEMTAEKTGDITPMVYENYFNACNGSRDLMEHVDPMAKGKMLEEVLVLLTGTDPAADEHYIKFEVTTHKGYGVVPHMYRNLFEAVRQTVRHSLGAQWNSDFASAWDHRIEYLLSEIEPAATS